MLAHGESHAGVLSITHDLDWRCRMRMMKRPRAAAKQAVQPPLRGSCLRCLGVSCHLEWPVVRVATPASPWSPSWTCHCPYPPPASLTWTPLVQTGTPSYCTCLPDCLLACLPARLLACLPACLLACLPACLLACLLALLAFTYTMPVRRIKAASAVV